MRYRLYRLDETGHIVSASDIYVQDDSAALHEAEMVCRNNAVEVWQGARRIAHINPGSANLRPSDRMSL